MGSQDALFNNQIFRKDNPIILACRRDQAVFMGARVIYDSTGYLPGNCLVRVTSTGLFSKWSAASGGTYDSPCVMFDQLTNDQETAGFTGGVSTGVSGASLVRVLTAAKGVYTANLIDYDSNFKTQLKSKDMTDAGGVGITLF
jgi:hypothetical protein